jgi:DNA-binding protein Fis
MPIKIRILAIAPYESMKPVLLNLSKKYQNVDLTILVGDLKKGAEIAQSNFHENFDVIISRGGTAKLIQESVSLPVIEINTSAYDILRTLKLSNADTKKAAIVGYPQVTGEGEFLKEVLPYSIDVYTINSKDEAFEVLQRLMREGYQAVLCDMITYTIARQFGLDAFLITSGVESIQTALNTAVRYCSSQSQLRSENHFLRQLIKGRDLRTAVFTADGKLFYSTVFDEDASILNILHEAIGEIPEGGKRRFLHRQDKLLYSIQAQRLVLDENTYVAFYFTVSKPPLAGSKCGVYYGNQNEVEEDFLNSFYSITNSVSPFNAVIEKVNQDLCPVIVMGENGTGKEQIAKAIYLRSSLKSQPFIEIDCILLSEKVWDYLMNNHNSPLCDAGNTIFIKNVNALTLQQQKQLLIALTDIEVCKRNRVIISFVSSGNEELGSDIIEFVNRLRFFTIKALTLREDLSRIESIVNLYLNQVNIHRENQILGVSPEALQMLRDFDWPYNYTQFKRVMNNLVVMAGSSSIDSDLVKEMLNKELSMTTALSNNMAMPLDLTRPLDEITKEIVAMVLESHGNNHSKAAESLGISRTTLWRLTNEKTFNGNQKDSGCRPTSD